MIVDIFSKKSAQKAKIEDAYAVNKDKNIYAVFDGVTPLIKQAVADEDNDARKASQLFKQHFEHPDVGVDLSRELGEANAKLREEMISSGLDRTQKHLLWSTCAVAVHVGTEFLCFSQLGDCMAIVLDTDGKVCVLTKNQVDGLEIRAKEKRKLDRSHGIYVPEESYFQDGYHQESYCRWMANIPGGYGVANGMPEMKDYIQTGQFPIKKIRAVLLISDGLFDPDHKLDYVMKQVETKGLEEYAKDLEYKEQERGLRPDDKTGIWLEL